MYVSHRLIHYHEPLFHLQILYIFFKNNEAQFFYFFSVITSQETQSHLLVQMKAP